MNTQTSPKTASIDMLHGPIMKALILFALPIIGSSVFQQLYNTVDTMIVGNVLGELSLAGIGAATPIYSLLICWALGMGNGIGIVTGRCFGQGDMEKVKRSVSAAILIGIGVSLVITAASRLFLHPLLVLLNTPDNIIGLAENYLTAITLFTFVTMAYNLCSGLLRAIGNSVMPLVFLIVSSLINIGLDLLFVISFGMGVTGAAVATGLSQLISAALCMVYIGIRVPILIPRKEYFLHPDRELAEEMLLQGLSMGAMSAIVDVGTVILQYGINGMGEYIIAAHTTARKVIQIYFMVFTSMGQAISTFTSQNQGAGRMDRIRTGLRDSMIYNAVLTVLLTALAFLAAAPMVRLVSGSGNQELLTNATRYIIVTSPFSVVLGAVFCYRLSLQGLGMKILPLISSVIEMCGKILFVIFLIPKCGYPAVMFCEPVIWCCMAVYLVITFYTNPSVRSVKAGV